MRTRWRTKKLQTCFSQTMQLPEQKCNPDDQNIFFKDRIQSFSSDILGGMDI